MIDTHGGDYYGDDARTTTVDHRFDTDLLSEVLEEFKYSLWHCGFSYVEDLEVIVAGDEITSDTAQVPAAASAAAAVSQRLR